MLINVDEIESHAKEYNVENNTYHTKNNKYKNITIYENITF